MIRVPGMHTPAVGIARLEDEGRLQQQKAHSTIVAHLFVLLLMVLGVFKVDVATPDEKALCRATDHYYELLFDKTNALSSLALPSEVLLSGQPLSVTPPFVLACQNVFIDGQTTLCLLLDALVGARTPELSLGTDNDRSRGVSPIRRSSKQNGGPHIYFGVNDQVPNMCPDADSHFQMRLMACAEGAPTDVRLPSDKIDLRPKARSTQTESSAVVCDVCATALRQGGYRAEAVVEHNWCGKAYGFLVVAASSLLSLMIREKKMGFSHLPYSNVTHWYVLRNSGLSGNLLAVSCGRHTALCILMLKKERKRKVNCGTWEMDVNSIGFFLGLCTLERVRVFRPGQNRFDGNPRFKLLVPRVPSHYYMSDLREEFRHRQGLAFQVGYIRLYQVISVAVPLISSQGGGRALFAFTGQASSKVISPRVRTSSKRRPHADIHENFLHIYGSRVSGNLNEGATTHSARSHHLTGLEREEARFHSPREVLPDCLVAWLFSADPALVFGLQCRADHLSLPELAHNALRRMEIDGCCITMVACQ
ncbi:hypothetical protein BDY19DRAFT_906230 [Irpex rosettiformis]|uniref:Uncharacterized protein n=1 Tax=Irpex rosettiformis TaxID=378272 RepID=A0ACB8U535_9APHY|nr:hypothetical protein BDY19DRAFT_906230 [Irpex rosettiformis]